MSTPRATAGKPTGRRASATRTQAGGSGRSGATTRTSADASSSGRSGSAGGRRKELLLDELRTAVSELLGAERRLRGREGHHGGDGLTFSQGRALVALDNVQEATAGELARAADLNPASMTPMLDHLEERGIVTRRRSTEDRRVCLVSLTPAGREMVAAKRARWTQMWRARLADLPAQELQGTAAVLHRIAELLDSL